MSRYRKTADAVASPADLLAGIDGMIASLVRSASQASHGKTVPEAGQIAAETECLRDVSGKWHEACGLLVRQIASAAADIDAVMPSADEPAAFETGAGWRRVIKWLKRIGTPGARHAIFSAPVSAPSSALARIDALYGLLVERRAGLAAQRQAVESDLVELAGHRAVLVDALAAASSPPDPGGGVSDYLALLQGLTEALNDQLRATSRMIDKLALEAERGLLLSHLLAPGAGQAGVAGNAPALPHLAPLVALLEKDMLSSIEIDRRKHNIDARFIESFESLLDKPPSAHYVKV